MHNVSLGLEINHEEKEEEKVCLWQLYPIVRPKQILTAKGQRRGKKPMGRRTFSILATH